MKIFKILVYSLAILIIGNYSCRKDSVIPAPSIEGHWISLLPSHPNWHYQFHDNILNQYIIDFGDTITVLSYPYAAWADQVLIGGDANNPQRLWEIRFHCDSVMKIHNVTPGVLIAPVMYFRKIQ